MADFFTTPSIVQSLLMLTLVMTIGLWLADKARIGHFSLGVTWVLFVGIIFSALHVHINQDVADFAKNFGLILFVYSIGLQVGPSFSPFKKGGLQLNLLALAIVLLGCACTIALHYITGVDMSTMAGVMSGAVISTPSLAAVQQAYTDITGHVNPDIATGYAVSYPLAVLGLILAFELIRYLFRVNISREEQRLQEESSLSSEEPICVDITLNNPQLVQLNISEFMRISPVKEILVSRVIRHDGTDELVTDQTLFGNGDILRVLTDRKHIDSLRLLGDVQNFSFDSKERSVHLISRRIAVTKPECNGKAICTFNLRQQYHATITRVNRAGIDLLATPNLKLQLGDRLMVVGDSDDVQRVADTFGNELKRLDLPNLLPVFFGIVLGILLGLMPIPIPGMNQSFKLGLAGGALIVALLIGRFGPYYNMVTFATTSANMMLRQVGLTLFMAALGLTAGEQFLPTILAGGYMWVLYGFLITIIPVLIVGSIAYKWLRINYFKVIGLMAGSLTAAPALGYAESINSSNDQASVCYATVYPLTTFMRVMVAQLLIVFFCSCSSTSTTTDVQLSNKYASGFRITNQDTCLLLEVMEPYSAYRVSQPLRRLGTSSVTQVGFLAELDALDQVVAVCNPELIYTPLPGRPIGLGDSMKPSAEQALLANLDAFLVVSYGQSNPEAERLERLGVKTIYINEWRENNPLARAEWIRFVGALVGRLPEADSIFAEIEQRYLTASAARENRADNKTSVMIGNNFRGTWYMPSGKTYMGYLLQDAGADYPYYSDTREESIPLTIEKVLAEFTDADVWIGAQAQSLDELAELDNKHTWFNAYKNHRVYNWRGQFREGRNNFWERGVVHPEEILEDIVAMLSNSPDSVLHYAQRLN